MRKYHLIEYILAVIFAPVWIPLVLCFLVGSGFLWALLFAVEIYEDICGDS